MSHVLAVVLIVLVALGIANVITPADPVSMLIAWAGLVAVCILFYLIGVHNGRKSGKTSR